MSGRERVGMLMLHGGTARDQRAREELAAALPADAEVGEADELGVFEIALDAAGRQEALVRVRDAVAAAGDDDHLLVLVPPRRGPRSGPMTLTTQQIPREAWRTYFDELSKHLGTVDATVEVIGPDIGDQIEAERLLLTGVTYDDRDDVVVIGLDAPGGPPEDLERIVEHPEAIYVATGGDDADLAIDIEDADQHKTILRVEHAPALPAAR
jgi:hypothetical protein